MENKINLTEIETLLLQKGRLYFWDPTYKTSWDFNDTDLDQFYFDIYTHQSHLHTLPELTGVYKETETFLYRSFRDQFLLCNYYLNCTLKDFLLTVKKYRPTGQYCKTIDAYVLFPGTHHKFKDFRLLDSNHKCKEFNNHSIMELLNAA